VTASVTLRREDAHRISLAIRLAVGGTDE
jgi:hypothetical protein